MANARVLTTDEEIDAALERASDAPPRPKVTRVDYLPEMRAVSVQINTGQRLLIPAEDLQQVSSASPEQLRHTEIIGDGEGIGFPAIDIHFSTEGLLAGRYGSRKWMQQLQAQRANALRTAA